jgi:hypothetical protein
VIQSAVIPLYNVVFVWVLPGIAVAEAQGKSENSEERKRLPLETVT